MKIKIMLILILLTPVSSLASSDKELAKCAIKKGDLERLACFDSVTKRLGLNGPQSKPVNVTGNGKWAVSAKENPIDDSRTATLILDADSGKSKWAKPIGLIIRCQSNETKLYISWQDYLGSEAYVLTRIGSNKAKTKRWSLSTDSRATFYPGTPIQFIKKMTTSNKLVSQVTPYNENPITAIFDTTGLKNAIKTVQETCNWS